MHCSQTGTRCRQSVSQNEESSSFCQMIRTSQAFVAALTPTCKTSCSKATACTLEIVALRAQPPIVVSGQSQSKYDAVVRKRDYFTSILRSLADHTGRLESNFAYLFYHTPMIRLVMQPCDLFLLYNFQLQPGSTDDIDDDASASTEQISNSLLNFILCLYLT